MLSWHLCAATGYGTHLAFTLSPGKDLRQLLVEVVGVVEKGGRVVSSLGPHCELRSEELELPIIDIFVGRGEEALWEELWRPAAAAQAPSVEASIACMHGCGSSV